MHRMPVFHDDQSFRDRTERMFREMQEKMGFHNFNDSLLMEPSWSTSTSTSTAHNPSFFELRPTPSPVMGQSQVCQVNGSSQQSEVLDDATLRSLFFDIDPQQGKGQGRLFRMSFDMRQYDPADINVRTENECLVVEAKHEDDQTTPGSKVSRQFCRRIQLPSGVDPMKLTSTLSADHILTVQAPVPPQYQAVVGSAGGCGQLQQQQQLQPPQLTVTIHSGGGSGRISPFQTIQQQQQIRVSPVPMAVLQQQQQLHAPAPLSVSSGRTSPRLVGSVVPVQTPLATAGLDMPSFSLDAASGRRRLNLVIDLGSNQYSGDDVAVRLDGRRLTVEARREIRDQPGRVSTSSTQKQYDLGEDIDPATIKASLDGDGRLTIVAFVR